MDNTVQLLHSSWKILIRPMVSRDIDAQISYLHDSPQEFLTQIGFDLAKRPTRDVHRAKWLENLTKDSEQGTFHSIIAEIDGKPIAIVYLPLRELPDVPRGHFHIFSQDFRGRGLGLPILKAGLKMLMNHHKVHQIYIEPKFDNLPMNKLMHKAGFRFLGESMYSSPVTTGFRAHRFEVTCDMLDL